MNKRGRRKSSKRITKTFKMLSANAAGIKSKMTTLKKIVSEENVNISFLQETNYKETGQMNLDSDFIIFERVRPIRDGGGGVALGCQKDL